MQVVYLGGGPGDTRREVGKWEENGKKPTKDAWYSRWWLWAIGAESLALLASCAHSQIRFIGQRKLLGLFSHSCGAGSPKSRCRSGSFLLGLWMATFSLCAHAPVWEPGHLGWGLAGGLHVIQPLSRNAVTLRVKASIYELWGNSSACSKYTDSFIIQMHLCKNMHCPCWYCLLR